MYKIRFIEETTRLPLKTWPYLPETGDLVILPRDDEEIVYRVTARIWHHRDPTIPVVFLEKAEPWDNFELKDQMHPHVYCYETIPG